MYVEKGISPERNENQALLWLRKEWSVGSGPSEMGHVGHVEASCWQEGELTTQDFYIDTGSQILGARGRFSLLQAAHQRNDVLCTGLKTSLTSLRQNWTLKRALRIVWSMLYSPVTLFLSSYQTDAILGRRIKKNVTENNSNIPNGFWKLMRLITFKSKTSKCKL